MVDAVSGRSGSSGSETADASSSVRVDGMLLPSTGTSACSASGELMVPSGHDPAMRCPVTGETCSELGSVLLDHLRPAIQKRIRQDHPHVASGTRISRIAADRYRKVFVEELLREERGELTELDREIARSLAEGITVSANVEEGFDEARSLGERLSDALAVFGGSWIFLICFSLGFSGGSG